MKSLGSMVPVGLIALALSGVAGCKKDEPPKPDPASTRAGPNASNRSKLNTRNPMGPVAKIDPQAMKDYRLDVCYFGTLSLRQARDAYLASLGKDEPSEKKIPSFGIPTPTPHAAPGASGAPQASAAAKPPVAPPKPSAAASASGAPAASAAPPALPERRPDVMVRAPHERNARACTAALALKEPPMGEVDAAIVNFANFAVDLAKDITTAHQYYMREEYKKDSFAKGKELDKKLREAFGKLDDLHGKVGTAVSNWRKAHPIDTSKMDEGEKLARAAIDEAREAFLLIAFKKADADAWKAALEKVEKSLSALKTYADSHTADPWGKIMAGPFEAYMKTAKDSKITADKGFESEQFLAFISNFTGLIEARQRAISRHAMARPAATPAASGAPAATGAPAEAPHP